MRSKNENTKSWGRKRKRMTVTANKQQRNVEYNRLLFTPSSRFDLVCGGRGCQQMRVGPIIQELDPFCKARTHHER
jgi:hypothetical protein